MTDSNFFKTKLSYTRVINPNTLKDLEEMMKKMYGSDINYVMPKEISGWKRILTDKESLTGFKGYIYIKGDDVAIVFEGSNIFSDAGDRNSDLQLLKGKIPDQLKFANKLYQKARQLFPGKNILQTGHSLGGRIAQMGALMHPDTFAIAFSPYGWGNVFENYPDLLNKTHGANILNYGIKGDKFYNPEQLFQPGISNYIPGTEKKAINNFYKYNYWETHMPKYYGDVNKAVPVNQKATSKKTPGVWAKYSAPGVHPPGFQTPSNVKSYFNKQPTVSQQRIIKATSRQTSTQKLARLSVGLGSLGGVLASGIGGLRYSQNTSLQYGNYNPKTGEFLKFHSGGVVPGRGEIIAMLMGGETVRTEEQEKALQAALLRKNSDSSENATNQNSNKNTLLPRLSKEDDQYVIGLIADAYKRNRYGLRTILRSY